MSDQPRSALPPLASGSDWDTLVAAFAKLTPDERQLLTCALAGNYPPQFEPLRGRVIGALAKADVGPVVVGLGKWNGGPDGDGETWTVEIDHDRFKLDEPVVVALEVRYEPPGEVHDALAMPSPHQARQMAAALVRAADEADRINQRHAAGDEGARTDA